MFFKLYQAISFFISNVLVWKYFFVGAIVHKQFDHNIPEGNLDFPLDQCVASSIVKLLHMSRETSSSFILESGTHDENFIE